MNYKKKIFQLKFFVLLSVLKLFYKKPDFVISYGIGLGDDLLCTIVIEQLKKKGYKRIWMMTYHPDIFLNNPYVDKILKKDDSGNINPLIKKYLKNSNVKFIYPRYTSYNMSTDRDVIPEKHIIEIMCEIACVETPGILKPLFYLTKQEKEKGKLFPNQVCIQSTGKGAVHYMKNKDWYHERFEEVILKLKDRYTVIQIGSADDDLLSGVIDMRGTTSIRETAAILYNSKFFIGQVGFLMHLSRSVDCKAVIIYGGRERPDQSGYESNINLYSAVSCSPCWYWNFCPNDKMCMKQISVSDVIEATEKILCVPASTLKLTNALH